MTVVGGDPNCDSGFGCGTIFEIASNATYTVLHSFEGGSDGAYPFGALTVDKADNLYGMTETGGSKNLGVVFKYETDGAEKILHTFSGGEDGAFPTSTLLVDKSGNLYGTTQEGGGRCRNSRGCGTIFELEADGTDKLLYAFSHRPKLSKWPLVGLTKYRDKFFGTTVGGGDKGCSHFCGVVYEIKR